MNAIHSFGAVHNVVMELDLDPIKVKLMHMASGEGWSVEKADAVEREYRRFLCLMKLHPNAGMAPLADVDTFWHYHILDTMKYAVDCDRVFGYFQHHDPYVGLDGEEDEQFRLDSGERMRELYEATFGDPYPASPITNMQTAFCAGPTHDRLSACTTDLAGAMAFCAGPTHDRLNVRAIGLAGAMAFCAGPTHDRLKAHEADLAPLRH
jgi:hypothetical protein